MTASTTPTARPAESIVTRLDRTVTAFRRFLEDRLPWYDRGEEEARMRRTQAIRRRSIEARIRAEAVLAEQRIAGRR